MRLSRHQIDILCFQVAKSILRQKAIAGITEEALADRVRGVIVADLQVEDRLNDEVRQVLEQYAEQMQESGAQYHEMFKKIKAKLVRERGLIL